MDITIDERKTALAGVIGAETDRITTVSLDIQRMREMGVLVDIDVHGTSMFTVRATWSELGIPRQDTRCKRLKRGSKDLLPKPYPGRLRSLETRFRQNLDKHSFVLDGFRPYRWIPFTAYEPWREEDKKLQEKLAALKAEIIANREQFVDNIAADFSRIAREAWDAIQARRPADAGNFALVTGGGTFDSLDAFTDYVVGRAVAQLPTTEQIERGLYVDYHNALLITGADSAAEHLRQAQLQTQVEVQHIAQRMAWEEERTRQQQLRLELDEAEEMQQMRLETERRKLAAMHEAELERARQQLTQMTSPFTAVIDQFRARIFQDVQEIAASIRKNGHVRGKVAERARGLLDIYRLLGAATDDDELEAALVELRSRLDHRPAEGMKYDTTSIENSLTQLATLTHGAAQEIAQRAGAHTRAGALMI